MIQEFNDVEVRKTGLIYDSVLDQIKQTYAMNPELAGELAISAIELILTGQVSSDNSLIHIMLANLKAINEHNIEKYENRVDAAREKKSKGMHLDEIAHLFNQGLSQRDIAQKLGISQQLVSYRMKIIGEQYPELLERKMEPPQYRF